MLRLGAICLADLVGVIVVEVIWLGPIFVKFKHNAISRGNGS